MATWESRSWEVRSDRGSCDAVLVGILDNLMGRNVVEGDIFAVRLALGEALTNAIKHGNQYDPTKTISIACRVTSEKMWIRIADQGAGYNPDGVPDPTDDENIEKLTGRGLKLMRSYMDVTHPQEDGRPYGSVVEMEKEFVDAGVAPQEMAV